MAGIELDDHGSEEQEDSCFVLVFASSKGKRRSEKMVVSPNHSPTAVDYLA